MIFIQPIKWLLLFILLVLYCSSATADTIYQWSDPWGQVQYSKTPVPGAMVSDLTELPETQETTEQQKQEAMLNKIQEMRGADLRRNQKNMLEKRLKQQNRKDEVYCNRLRNNLADVRLSITRSHSLLTHHYFPGVFFLPGGHGFLPNLHYDILERNLYREIRNNCR